MTLSERVRPWVEAVPWVIKEIERLEEKLAALEAVTESRVTIHTTREVHPDVPDRACQRAGHRAGEPPMSQPPPMPKPKNSSKISEKSMVVKSGIPPMPFNPACP